MTIRRGMLGRTERGGAFGSVDREPSMRARQQLMEFIDTARQQWMETEALRIGMEQETRREQMGQQRLQAFQQALAQVQAPEDIGLVTQQAIPFVQQFPEMATFVDKSIKRAADKVAPIEEPRRRTELRETEAFRDGRHVAVERLVDTQTGETIEETILREIPKEDSKPSDRFQAVAQAVAEDFPGEPLTQQYERVFRLLNTGRMKAEMEEAEESLMDHMTVRDGEWEYDGSPDQARDLLTILGSQATRVGLAIQKVDPEERTRYMGEWLNLEGQILALEKVLGLDVELPPEDDTTDAGIWNKLKRIWGSVSSAALSPDVQSLLGRGRDAEPGVLPDEPPVPVANMVEDVAQSETDPNIWLFRSDGEWLKYEWIPHAGMWTKRE